MPLFSQGLVENPLSSNPVLVQKWSTHEEQSVSRTASITDTINLGTKGILDDFSYEGPYPDTSLWLDDKVYINRGFAVAPVTIGAATFDGLDANGYPYDFTVSQTSTGQADYLTSKPINLSYPASDSIYFSFYYQPQGRGNAPESKDSLVLQFKIANGWKNVWAKSGTSLSPSDSSWTLVMVPITDPSFLIKGFQFRFKNYATLSGNLDHWSIDYVYLNRIRSKNDTNFEDVSFVYNTPSLLKNYSVMPWNHYGVSNMKTTYATTIRNNHTVTKNGSFFYNIYDASETQVNTTYSGGNVNIDPYITNKYLNFPAFTSPALNYTIPALTNPTHYTIESIVNSTPDFNRKNDTIRHTQEFSNYYAYDDGTAEATFGMSTLNSMLAQRFTSTITDTLRCVDIYFNPVITNVTQYTFRLKVWSDNGGTPGTVIYTSDTVLSPFYNPTGPNQFARYYLKVPLILPASTFYVGFQQNTNQFLNIGVDKNTNTQDKIVYNVTGTWNNSPFAGSLMMHPVFGSASSFIGVNDIVKEKNSVSVYPNPANDKLYIHVFSANEAEKIAYTIIDLFGRIVLENSITPSEYIDISTISDGVYFIRTVNGEQTATIKFIKTN